MSYTERSTFEGNTPPGTSTGRRPPAVGDSTRRALIALALGAVGGSMGAIVFASTPSAQIATTSSIVRSTGPEPAALESPAAESLYLVLFDGDAVAARLPQRAATRRLAATDQDSLPAEANDPGTADRTAIALPSERRGAVSRDDEAWIAADRALAGRAATVGATLGRPVRSLYRLRGLRLGQGMFLTAAEAERLRRQPGIRAVVADRQLPLESDLGPAWIGAPAVWDGTAFGREHQGEGVVVGIIDSGIQMDHASFSDEPEDGFRFRGGFKHGAHPPIGWCDPKHPDFQTSFVCNDKLIGGWDFMDEYCAAHPLVCDEADGPGDNYGHGTHVASTAAGNKVTLSPLAHISGVAPHARLIAYDACSLQLNFLPFCSSVAVAAAIDQAYLDGVDVINISILGGISVWNGSDDDLLFDAFAQGAFVAASAGNNGPSEGTVIHRAPWVMTAAASTHDRAGYLASVGDFAGGSGTPPATLTGGGLSGAFGPANVVYAGHFEAGHLNDEKYCTEPFPPGTFPSGAIVVCELGFVPIEMKAAAIEQGGGDALVMLSPFATIEIGYNTVVPSVWLGTAASNALRAWLLAGTGHSGRLFAAELAVDASRADRIQNFSSRGPNPSLDVIKPDVAAPGASILAATADRFTGATGEPPIQYMSGTSMASPFVAGAAALLRSANPEWSPSEVKSALMLTASPDLLLQTGATVANVRARGAGRIDVANAARSGLLLDESAENYAAADPNLGGDPRQLNLASLMDSSCAGACGFRRTLEGASRRTVEWQTTSDSDPNLVLGISPAHFELRRHQQQDLHVVAYVVSGSPGSWRETTVRLLPDVSDVPEAAIPLLVRTVSGAAAADIEVELQGPSRPKKGSTTSFYVTVRNDGPHDAAGVSVFFDPPPGAQAEQWMCYEASAGAECQSRADDNQGDTPFIPAGGQVSYRVRVKLRDTPAGPTTAQAGVVLPFAGLDPNPSNNNPTVNLTVR